jgi:hypothetical protein
MRHRANSLATVESFIPIAIRREELECQLQPASPATRRQRDLAREDARGSIFDRRGRALEGSRNLRSMLIELEVQIGDDLQTLWVARRHRSSVPKAYLRAALRAMWSSRSGRQSSAGNLLDRRTRRCHAGRGTPIIIETTR